MRIAVAKPDWRIIGGFERLLDRLCARLEARGHEIVRMEVDVPSAYRTPYGVVVPDKVWKTAPEYFQYLSLNDTFRAMEFPAGTDVVLSTQPPSFAASHPAHVSMFFHHARMFYDLSDTYIAAGLVDAERHQRAAHWIRGVDRLSLQSVRQFLVSSQEVADRLKDFGPVAGGLSEFLPPPMVSDPGGERRPGPEEEPVALCVGRHEFPKRMELFVQAMHLTPATVGGVCVGTGGRELFARTLDDDFACGRLDPETATEHQVWLNRGDRLRRRRRGGRVRFAGRSTDRELIEAYRRATCVVAPAFREDYGLTALEAMAFGKPVVACTDGGGLAELVEHGVTGFVVEPTGPAVARAITRLCEDRDLGREMGRVARDRAQTYTWDAAVSQVEHALHAAVPA